MKYRISSLTTLLVIGLLSSASALAAPGHQGHRQQPQRSAPPSHQVRQAPPPQQVRQAPSHQQARQAPPPRQVHQAPPPRQVRKAPPPRQVYRAPPPQPVVYTSSHRPGRSWQVGRALPHTVVYHEVSAPYYTQYRLAPPPHNHRYVRVGDDILLIAIGTGLIASAIYNIAH